VIHFLEAERHCSYATFLEPDDYGYFPRGQFYAGLDCIDPERALQFEELLIALSHHLQVTDDEDPCHVTDKVLRIGVRRLLWCIHFFIWQIEASYAHFAANISSCDTAAVITFNWDILVERLLADTGVHWSYSPDQPGAIPVIKPHGSINWSRFAQENLKPEYAAWQPIRRGSTLSFDSAHPLANPDLQEQNPDLQYSIFPGDPDIPAHHRDAALLWDDAHLAIERSEKVVFIGYSLPSYDTFAAQFFAASASAKRVEVYNPDDQALEAFKRTFPTAHTEKAYFCSTPYAQNPKRPNPTQEQTGGSIVARRWRASRS